MTDLHTDNKPGRSALLPASGELQRRKEPRGGRRTFRSWPLLPVPAGAAAGRRHVAPSVDWPQGHAIDGDDWQDKPDRRDLGTDFAPASDAPFWQESDSQPQVATRSRALKICLLASVALHLSCAVFLISMPQPETVEIAGGGAVSVMLVGEQAFDSLAAGKADGEEMPQPVEEAKAVETAEQPVEATTTEEVVEPADMETAVAEPVAETQPAEANPPAETAAATSPPEQVAETAPEVPNEAPTEIAAAPENLAIDASAVSETGELTPEPQVIVTETKPQETVEKVETPPVDAIKPPEPMKPVEEPEKKSAEKKPTSKKLEKPKTEEKPKAEEKKVAARKKADTEQEARQAPVKSRKGEAGEATANAQRGTSAAANGATRADPGNAAVSNYPGKVAAKLRRALKYPKSAVSGGGGQAQVAFTVQADGSATGIRVVSSSGSPVLDQAAMDAVRRASPFPPIPEEAGRRQWPFAVPVLFRR